MIIEPALQNIGIVMPDAGYLAGVREMCDATGTLLIFDEVKIGITAHWGGATTLFGVRPDLVCVSKSIGGGLPLGAFGGRADVMDEVRPGRVTHVGTFSGNPLALAAAPATLNEVCTPEATTTVIERANRLADGCESVIGKYQLPAHVVRMGARGCITWRPCRAQLSGHADVHTHRQGAMVVLHQPGSCCPRDLIRSVWSPCHTRPRHRRHDAFRRVPAAWQQTERRLASDREQGGDHTGARRHRRATAQRFAVGRDRRDNDVDEARIREAIASLEGLPAARSAPR